MASFLFPDFSGFLFLAFLWFFVRLPFTSGVSVFSGWSWPLLCVALVCRFCVLLEEQVKRRYLSNAVQAASTGAASNAGTRRIVFITCSAVMSRVHSNCRGVFA
jgi:hypothetical protein